jgi:hypothetical protein
MTEGAILKNFIENQKISKTAIASDLSMSRQNLYQLFESEVLEQETKDKFEGYFKSSIFTHADNIDTLKKKAEGPKSAESDVWIQTIYNLSVTAKDHAETDLIHARIIEYLLTIVGDKKEVKGLIKGRMGLAPAGTPGSKTMPAKEDE